MMTIKIAAQALVFAFIKMRWKKNATAMFIVFHYIELYKTNKLLLCFNVYDSLTKRITNINELIEVTKYKDNRKVQKYIVNTV